MHKEILSEKQLELLPLAKVFSEEYLLVGGTAIALYLGHRKSIDLDLFTSNKIQHNIIRNRIKEERFEIVSTLVENPQELTLVVNGVKITFLQYPYLLNKASTLDDFINLPSINTLSAMKAYALGRRAKWKDYVDLYFIFTKYGMENTLKSAKDIFGEEFNEKMFRTQLAYFGDIDYSEKVEYTKNNQISDETIKQKLVEFSLI